MEETALVEVERWRWAPVTKIRSQIQRQTKFKWKYKYICMARWYEGICDEDDESQYKNINIMTLWHSVEMFTCDKNKMTQIIAYGGYDAIKWQIQRQTRPRDKHKNKYKCQDGVCHRWGERGSGLTNTKTNTNTNTNTNAEMVMLTGEGEGGGAAIETHSGEEGWPRRRLQLEHCCWCCWCWCWWCWCWRTSTYLLFIDVSFSKLKIAMMMMMTMTTMMVMMIQSAGHQSCCSWKRCGLMILGKSSSFWTKHHNSLYVP